MALCDRIQQDISRVFLNHDHFATWHTWNGKRFQCVTDEEAALKRKNNNVVDLSWDNNTTETLLYVRKEEFPGRIMPNEHGFFDNRPMKILQVNEDMGMVSIALVSFDPKAVGGV
jgi:hypothetical protein|nr:MAG TPA: Gifsy-2 prophage ATP-binding sugar transporter-like barrel, 4 helix bundle.7A [Caudoviricetes sp.]